jgi:hypothetical protein
VRVNQTKAYSRELEEKIFLSLFLRNNQIIKCLEHCVRFKLTTEDTKDKAFSDRGTNTYERETKRKKEKEKKKEKDKTGEKKKVWIMVKELSFTASRDVSPTKKFFVALEAFFFEFFFGLASFIRVRKRCGWCEINRGN